MENYKLVKKAYRINFGRIDNGFLACDVVCNADSVTKAKSKLLGEIRYDSWQILKTGEDVNYLNIPVVRAPEYDLYEFEGESVSSHRIDEILRERARIKVLDDVMLDDSVKYCYIMKRGGYYGPKFCGYTSLRHKAGVYTKKEAVSEAKSCDEVSVVPIDMEKHNKMMSEEISELQTKILQ